MMELNKDTRLKDLLEAYPNIKARLSKVNPKFAMISSPMGKLMIPKVTISDMSERSGMEIDALIEELLTLENPFNCPHGRPTIISMSKYEIEKKFKRIVT